MSARPFLRGISVICTQACASPLFAEPSFICACVSRDPAEHGAGRDDRARTHQVARDPQTLRRRRLRGGRPPPARRRRARRRRRRLLFALRR